MASPARSDWWLIETRVGLALIAAVVLVGTLAGIALDAWTRLDVRALLSGLTAVGAFVVAGYAARQVSLFRRDMEARLRPHIAIDDIQPTPVGIDIELRNHGGGVAQFLRVDAYLIRGREPQSDRPDDAIARFAQSSERTIENQAIGSLGPSLSGWKRLRWDEEIQDFAEDWTLLARFTFVDPTNTERHNDVVKGFRTFRA